MLVGGYGSHMRAARGFDGRLHDSGSWTAFRRLLTGVTFAAAMAPGIVAAQEASSESEGSTAKLPEIHVIATTPVAPPPRRAPVARATGPANRAPTPAPPPAPAEATAAKPIPGAVDQDKIPANVQTAGAPDFSYTVTPDLLQSMVRALPGVSLGSQTGNEFQPDINYRGFVASPVIGTPQGIAVYQNGVRINEVFGDIVNWDFIPQNAINQLTLVPSNPVYGLNATGASHQTFGSHGRCSCGCNSRAHGGDHRETHA